MFIEIKSESDGCITTHGINTNKIQRYEYSNNGDFSFNLSI